MCKNNTRDTIEAHRRVASINNYNNGENRNHRDEHRSHRQDDQGRE
jgi:hypothetical protein